MVVSALLAQLEKYHRVVDFLKKVVYYNRDLSVSSLDHRKREEVPAIFVRYLKKL